MDADGSGAAGIDVTEKNATVSGAADMDIVADWDTTGSGASGRDIADTDAVVSVAAGTECTRHG